MLPCYFDVVGAVEDGRPVLGLVNATELHAVVVAVSAGKRSIQCVAIQGIVRYSRCKWSK